MDPKADKCLTQTLIALETEKTGPTQDGQSQSGVRQGRVRPERQSV